MMLLKMTSTIVPLLCGYLFFIVYASKPEPFTINVPEKTLNDLSNRLENTIFPDSLDLPNDDAWSHGIPVKSMREYVDYWKKDYDWRAQEKYLNTFDHFKMDIDGINIHFVHALSKEKGAVPLLVVHGWPGSFLECLKAIPILTDPVSHGRKASDAFHVVCPSLPGYGFSEHPKEPGINTRKIASIFAQLMANLKYDKYMTQGGDWGGIITMHLANLDTEHVLGTHLNFIPLSPVGFFGNVKFLLSFAFPSWFYTPQEQKYVSYGLSYYWREFGYFHMQTTRPTTLGYGLADSPVGLAAWILDKFHFWTDTSDDMSVVNVSKEDMITNIMIYWVTNSITSSSRLYKEHWLVFKDEEAPILETTPIGVCQFHKEIILTGRMLADQHFYNILSFDIKESGGHFALLEATEELVDHVIEFKHKIEKQLDDKNKEKEDL